MCDVNFEGFFVKISNFFLFVKVIVYKLNWSIKYIKMCVLDFGKIIFWGCCSYFLWLIYFFFFKEVYIGFNFGLVVYLGIWLKLRYVFC